MNGKNCLSYRDLPLTFVPFSVTLARIISPGKGRRREGRSRRRGERRSPRGGLQPAPGRSGHHACRHYDRCARCVAGTGRGNRPTKPGPDRTKGLHTPWEEPWWNAGRRAVRKRAAPHPKVRRLKALRLPAFHILFAFGETETAKRDNEATTAS